MSTPRKFGPGKAAGRSSLKGKAPSSTKQPKPRGIDPSNPMYGIATSTSKSKGAVTQPSGRNTASGQQRLTSKAKRQFG